MHCSRNASHLPKTSPGPLACYCKQSYRICTVRPTQLPDAPNSTVTGARTPTAFTVEMQIIAVVASCLFF